MTAPSPLATPMPWDLIAGAYEAEVLPQFEPFAREALRLAAPPPGARVADVACGPGTLALLAARAGFAVDAVDFSTEMVDRLEHRLRSGSIERVTARVGDGQALPFADGAYAGAFSMFGLMFFADRARGFAELRRILAPGARAVVSSWQPLETVPAMAAMFGALRDTLSGTFAQGGAPEQREMPLTTPEACRAEMGGILRQRGGSSGIHRRGLPLGGCPLGVVGAEHGSHRPDAAGSRGALGPSRQSRAERDGGSPRGRAGEADDECLADRGGRRRVGPFANTRRP